MSQDRRRPVDHDDLESSFWLRMRIELELAKAKGRKEQVDSRYHSDQVIKVNRGNRIRCQTISQSI